MNMTDRHNSVIPVFTSVSVTAMVTNSIFPHKFTGNVSDANGFLKDGVSVREKIIYLALIMRRVLYLHFGIEKRLFLIAELAMAHN